MLAGAAPAGAAPAPESLILRARALLVSLQRSSPGRVLNATGVILHTNLGRAPLAATAREAVAGGGPGHCDPARELGTGTRGRRPPHIEEL
ncbi:MAG: L-seryl-tRNA(Sec) selenium transferase, partial [Solirubrobacterales bacterium]